jgi:protein-tyrosine phosphatase
MRAVATLKETFKSSLEQVPFLQAGAVGTIPQTQMMNKSHQSHLNHSQPKTTNNTARTTHLQVDARASELERENLLLKDRLEASESQLRYLQANGGGGGGSSGSMTGDAVPAVNVEHHINGLSRATSVLAEESGALSTSLQSAALAEASSGLAGSQRDAEVARAKELAAMHQRLLQLHVGFIMHGGGDNEAKVQEHAAALGAMSERDMELAWFWFRGAVAALGGALRGRTNMSPQIQHSNGGCGGGGGGDEDDDEVRVAWGNNDEEEEQQEEEQGWTSEEDDEDGQVVASLEPFMGHKPHWAHKEWAFQELEPFNSIARRGMDYCGPSDESNWVLPDVLLVGAFPGVPDDDENWELITSILGLGVTTFVCLQDEYSDEAPEEDWRYERNGAIRPYFRDVREIVKQVEEADPDEFPNIHITSSDLHFIHFPIIDCDIGEDDAVYGLAVDLVERLAKGEVIYLHCWGGHGRTGSLVCIMLHLMYGLSAKDSMERCQFVHDLRRVPMEVSSPQKPSQRNQVRRIIGALEMVEEQLQASSSS